MKCFKAPCNIKIDLREIGTDGVNWIQMAQDRVQWQAFLSKESRLLFGKLNDYQLFKEYLAPWSE
jgi:hypothetical protein